MGETPGNRLSGISGFAISGIKGINGFAINDINGINGWRSAVMDVGTRQYKRLVTPCLLIPRGRRKAVC